MMPLTLVYAPRPHAGKLGADKWAERGIGGRPTSRKYAGRSWLDSRPRIFSEVLGEPLECNFVVFSPK
jgi:hypothetical protein